VDVERRHKAVATRTHTIIWGENKQYGKYTYLPTYLRHPPHVSGGPDMAIRGETPTQMLTAAASSSRFPETSAVRCEEDPIAVTH
jgi:hypothetical protein